MSKARTTLGLLFLVTVVLGGWSVRAIRRTAGRRATLVDGLARAVPLPAGTRVLVPWQPVADVDLAHTTLCFDDTEPGTVLADFARALGRGGWRISPPEGAIMSCLGGAGARPGAPRPTSPLAVSADNATYRLRGSIEPARRLDCDDARKQVLLSVEAAPR
jgi:hypothetical protein